MKACQNKGVVVFLSVFCLLSGVVHSQVIPISSINELQKIGIDPLMPLDGDYILTKNIDATDTRNWNGGMGFDPIGDDLNPFTGTLDGNGYTIQGLFIRRPQESSIGLFARLGGGARVQNLKLTSLRVVGDDYVGAICGVNVEGILSQCVVSGNIQGNNYVGGFVGSNTGGLIENCAGLTGSVTGVENVGGIAGENSAGSLRIGRIRYSYSSIKVAGSENVGGLVGHNYNDIFECFSTGFVSGYDRCIGGLVGSNEASGSIVDCFSTGPVKGGDVVGGLIGDNFGNVQNTYSTGYIVCLGSYKGGLIGWCDNLHLPSNSYWDIEASGESSSPYGEGRNTSDMIRQANYVSWDFVNVWDISEGTTYPFLKRIPLPVATYTVTLLSSPNGVVEIEGGGTNFPRWAPVTLVGTPDDGYSLAGWYGTMFLANQPLNCPGNFRFAISNDVSIGAVFLTDPVQITSIAELQKIGKDNFYPIWWNYDLANDIDASETASWNEGKGFEPIGSESEPFTGSLDGNGFKILQLYVHRTTLSDDNIGLIGFNMGKISRLFLVSPNIAGNNSVGALAGFNIGSIYNCGVFDASIDGNYFVGGIVGQDYGGEIYICYFRGMVNGSSFVGGAVGSTSTSTNIWECYTEGSVYAVNSYAGGFVGYHFDGVIENCFSTSGVSGNDIVGGFVGEDSGYIQNCYSIGQVDGLSNVGGFAGLSVSPPTKSALSCYWDMETSGQSTSAEGEGRTTVQMKQSANYDSWDFESVWRIIENMTYPFLRYLPVPSNYDVEVPDLFGLRQGVAEEILNACGLVLGEVSEDCNESAENGTVIGQSPEAHTIVEIGSSVDIVMNCCVTVPNLLGELLDNAVLIIQENNLVVGEVYYMQSSEPENTIIGQYPSEGSVVRCGTSVDLWVSAGLEGEGVVEGTLEGEGMVEGVPEGVAEGTPEGTPDGEGVIEGTPEGEGSVDGAIEGTPEGEGSVDGSPEGMPEGEGAVEGEGMVEGTPEGEGVVEGVIEGEGIPEGEMPPHTADQNGDWQISLSELLRVVQFFNMGGYHCALPGEETEDGYVPGYEGDKSCTPHASDYNPQDWIINLSELLRLIQFFNMNGYHPCPGTEDNYCPGP